MSEKCPGCGAEMYDYGQERYPDGTEGAKHFKCGAEWYPTNPPKFYPSADCLRRQLTQAKARYCELAAIVLGCENGETVEYAIVDVEDTLHAARDSQDAFDKLCEIVETERQRDEAKLENERLKAGRKRWYPCAAGIFEGELNQVTLHSDDTRPGDWVMPEKYCFVTREAAEADAAEEAAEAAKENTGV